jgi:antitoxin ParD1/3/4
MDVSLTPELEQLIYTLVESVKFASALEVIEAGIRLLDERERLYQGRFEELRQEVLIGVEQLDRGERLNGKAVIEQLRQRNQARKQVQP